MAQNPLSQPVNYPYYEATVTESTRHFKSISYLQQALLYRYRDSDDVFVGANNYVYWEEGNVDDKQAPDVYVCFGARNIERSSYKAWEEGGILPQVVFEVTSKSSRITDLGTKKAVYEMLGVEEYYAFDPLKEFIPQGLRAFRLKNGAYVEVIPKMSKGSDKTIRVYSPRLNLDLGAPSGKTPGILRLFEPGKSAALPTYEEMHELADQERLRADQERLRAERYARKMIELGIDLESL